MLIRSKSRKWSGAQPTYQGDRGIDEVEIAIRNLEDIVVKGVDVKQIARDYGKLNPKERKEWSDREFGFRTKSVCTDQSWFEQDLSFSRRDLRAVQKLVNDGQFPFTYTRESEDFWPGFVDKPLNTEIFFQGGEGDRSRVAFSYVVNAEMSNLRLAQTLLSKDRFKSDTERHAWERAIIAFTRNEDILSSDYHGTITASRPGIIRSGGVLLSRNSMLESGIYPLSGERDPEKQLDTDRPDVCTTDKLWLALVYAATDYVGKDTNHRLDTDSAIEFVQGLNDRERCWVTAPRSEIYGIRKGGDRLNPWIDVLFNMATIRQDSHDQINLGECLEIYYHPIDEDPLETRQYLAQALGDEARNSVTLFPFESLALLVRAIEIIRSEYSVDEPVELPFGTFRQQFSTYDMMRDPGVEERLAEDNDDRSSYNGLAFASYELRGSSITLFNTPFGWIIRDGRFRGREKAPPHYVLLDAENVEVMADSVVQIPITDEGDYGSSQTGYASCIGDFFTDRPELITGASLDRIADPNIVTIKGKTEFTAFIQEESSKYPIRDPSTYSG
tara:strand:- start:94 stop:1764 length:1671 start_codon:yes stop_codon:yes gene_type:complete